MRRPVISACLFLLSCLLAFGCGGRSDVGGGETENGIAIGPHLYRNLEKTLPELIAEQADSPDHGTVREFVATRSFLLLPPKTFTRPDSPTWRVEDGTSLDSVAYLWPGVNGGHVLHIRGQAGLRGTYWFAGEEAVGGWGDPDDESAWPVLFGARHASDVGIEHDIALAYADTAGGESLQYAAYGWWAMAPVPGGGASDTTRRSALTAG